MFADVTSTGGGSITGGATKLGDAKLAWGAGVAMVGLSVLHGVPGVAATARGPGIPGVFWLGLQATTWVALGGRSTFHDAELLAKPVPMSVAAPALWAGTPGALMLTAASLADVGLSSLQDDETAMSLLDPGPGVRDLATVVAMSLLDSGPGVRDLATPGVFGHGVRSRADVGRSIFQEDVAATLLPVPFPGLCGLGTPGVPEPDAEPRADFGGSILQDDELATSLPMPGTVT